MVTEEWIRITNIDIEPPQARAIILHLKNQIDIARLQFRRIREGRARSEELLKMNREYSELQRQMKIGKEREDTWKKALDAHTEWSKQYAIVYADYQFLIIIARFYELLKKLKNLLPRHEELVQVWKKYQKWLKDYRDYRDAIEHMEDEIDESDRANLESYVIGIGYEFMIVKSDIEISDKTESELDKLFLELVSAFRSSETA